MRYLPYLVVIAASLVSACSSKEPVVDDGNVMVNTAMFSVDPQSTALPPGTPDYTGRWIGVEGTYLVATKDKAPGSYTLEMQYDLDHKQTVTGKAEGNTIVFTRDGKPESLKPANGDATGLKYLAGKKECLRVKDGEGYCRT